MPHSPGAARAHTYCTPFPKNRVIVTQQTCVHDAICFFVAFSLTDFVSCGFASFFFSAATSAKNAASDFLSLGTFHRSLIAFTFSSFPRLQQPQPSGYCVVRFVGHPQPERTASRQPRRT